MDEHEVRSIGQAETTGPPAPYRPVHRMRLFVAGDEPNSVMARRNLDEICGANLQGNFELEIIDVFEDFDAAIEENILVTPALVIDQPKKAKIYGNLQDSAKVSAVLGLQ